MTKPVMVWDVPMRVFHWLLVLSFVGAYLTAESEPYREIHVMFGYTLLGLITFRLLWGFFGTRYSQFRSFIFTPGETFTYFLSMLKGNPTHYVGHNPLGSLAIWLLLSLGIITSVTGIVYFQGIGDDVIEVVHTFLAHVMLVVVLVHIAGVFLSSKLHHENLLLAMITGSKPVKASEGINRPYLWLGFIIVAAVALFWINYPPADLLAQKAGIKQNKPPR